MYTPAPTFAAGAASGSAGFRDVPSSDSASDSSLQPSPNPSPDSPSLPADPIAPAIVNGAGTATAYALFSKWFNEFHKLNPASEFNYQAIGNAAGIKRLLENDVDFAAADVPITDQQLAAAQTPILHVPSVLSGVVPIYNVAGAAQLRFSPAILVGIYSGKITYWNDLLIAVSNPRTNLPDEPITAIHRSDLCAATFVFTDYLSKISADWQQTVGKGTSVNWPVGLGAKGNEGVVGLVKQAPGTIGFVDYLYAIQKQIPFGSVQNSSGKFITADLASLTAAAVLPSLPTDFGVSITNAPGLDSYPISSFVWFLAPLRSHSPSEASDLVAFFRWMLGSGRQRYAGNLGYAPLPELAARVQLQVSIIH